MLVWSCSVGVHRVDLDAGVTVRCKSDLLAVGRPGCSVLVRQRAVGQVGLVGPVPVHRVDLVIEVPVAGEDDLARRRRGPIDGERSARRRRVGVVGGIGRAHLEGVRAVVERGRRVRVAGSRAGSEGIGVDATFEGRAGLIGGKGEARDRVAGRAARAGVDRGFGGVGVGGCGGDAPIRLRVNPGAVRQIDLAAPSALIA